MRAGSEIVYVALGANLADREATFEGVIDAIDEDPDLQLLAASPIFETDPVGPPGQGRYLNAVVELRVGIEPIELLNRLHAIERKMGRDRKSEIQRWGPRKIDLDILFFGDRRIESSRLSVPHVHAHERNFVMVPMAELAPTFLHPELQITMAEIARSFPASVTIRPRPSGWPEPKSKLSI